MSVANVFSYVGKYTYTYLDRWILSSESSRRNYRLALHRTIPLSCANKENLIRRAGPVIWPSTRPSPTRRTGCRNRFVYVSTQEIPTRFREWYNISVFYNITIFFKIRRLWRFRLATGSLQSSVELSSKWSSRWTFGNVLSCRFRRCLTFSLFEFRSCLRRSLTHQWRRLW